MATDKFLVLSGHYYRGGVLKVLFSEIKVGRVHFSKMSWPIKLINILLESLLFVDFERPIEWSTTDHCPRSRVVKKFKLVRYLRPTYRSKANFMLILKKVVSTNHWSLSVVILWSKTKIKVIPPTDLSFESKFYPEFEKSGRKQPLVMWLKTNT